MKHPMVRPLVGALVAALALVTAPAAAQEPPAPTTQQPTVPRQAVAEDENPWALAVLIVGVACVVVGIAGGLFGARGRMRTLSGGESARRPPHPAFARPVPGGAQARYVPPFPQPGIRLRKSTESVSDQQPVAPGPKRAAGDGAAAALDETAAQGEWVDLAWEEPEARTAQPPIEGHADPQAAASVMPKAPAAETTIEIESEPAAKLEPVPESAAAEQPESLVVEEPQAPPGEEVPETEPAQAEAQEEIAEARPEAAPGGKLKARADKTAAKPKPEVAVSTHADEVPENAPAPTVMRESHLAAEEAPSPAEEKPGEPDAANKPAPRARKKSKARPKQAASKAKEKVPPAEPKQPRPRRPRRSPG